MRLKKHAGEIGILCLGFIRFMLMIQAFYAHGILGIGAAIFCDVLLMKF